MGASAEAPRANMGQLIKEIIEEKDTGKEIGEVMGAGA